MKNANAPLVEVKDLKFSYRAGEPILKGVSFSIRPGELVAVTGPSGSGKSTLFYLLGCLLDKFEGEVLIRGQKTKSLSQNERSWIRNREIGFVFQQFYLLPRATVLENILLPTYFPFDDSAPSKEDRARAAEIAEKLGITALLDRNPQELSGGQQQRVAIARALLRKAQLILADEPTGNLDSKSSASVMELLKELHREGHTVIIVTHSPEIAEQCSRVIHIRDGLLENDELKQLDPTTEFMSGEELNASHNFKGFGLGSFLKSLPIAWDNIKRSRAKSALTMLGVSLGVAAVLSTMSLGSFAKQKILQGYQTLGINTVRFIGYRAWGRSPKFAPAIFQQFKWETDVQPLRNVFPEIESASPYMTIESPTISFGGNSFADNTMALGVNEEYFPITGLKVIQGRALSMFDIEGGVPVCVIGSQVKERLFQGIEVINRTINVGVESSSSLPCKVIGVLEKQESTQSAQQPDSQVFMPYTYTLKSTGNFFQPGINQILLKIAEGFDPSDTGAKLEGYFRSRYGSTGEFYAASDAKLISQMKLFLSVFSGLLAAVAIIALVVGGVGINNMMLASLSERLKELGLRKALGATPRQLRYLMLGESVLLCTAAGVIGLVVGATAYQGLVLAATKFIPTLEYEWIFEPTAFLVSFVAIFATGLLSGLIPSMKAEKLDVMEALRQDI